jgi:hypothetical protein
VFLEMFSNSGSVIRFLCFGRSGYANKLEMFFLPFLKCCRVGILLSRIMMACKVWLILASGVMDPDFLDPDPDPAFQVNPNPDPVF